MSQSLLVPSARLLLSQTARSSLSSSFVLPALTTSLLRPYPFLRRLYNTPSQSSPSNEIVSSSSPEQVAQIRKKLHLDDLCHYSYDPHHSQPLADFLALSSPLTYGQTLPHLQHAQLVSILESPDKTLFDALRYHADSVTRSVFGNKVIFRGIVEFSNVCIKDCKYCGIRKSKGNLLGDATSAVKRYTMTKEEIIDCAKFCFQQGYGTVMLQSGELETESRIQFLEDVIRTIREVTIHMEDTGQGYQGEKNVTGTEMDISNDRGLCVALSVGEMSQHNYQRLYDAGASRYLLRIETSDKELYQKIHPADHSWTRRHECLETLRRIGFQVGTGIMIGFPQQTLDHLAKDLLYFVRMQPDMLGMGPYVHQPDTPIGQMWEQLYPDDASRQAYKSYVVNLTLKMYALARIMLRDCNLPATTALQALEEGAREKALQSGSNVLMPIVTPSQYRAQYKLYDDKPCIDEGATQCLHCLINRVKWSGKEVAFGIWGNPPHFKGATAHK